MARIESRSLARIEAAAPLEPEAPLSPNRAPPRPVPRRPTVCPGPASTDFFKSITDKKIDGLRIEDPELIVRKAVRDSLRRKSVSIYGYEMNFLRVISKLFSRRMLAYFSGKVKLPK